MRGEGAEAVWCVKVKIEQGISIFRPKGIYVQCGFMGWLQGEQGSMVDRKEWRPPSDTNPFTREHDNCTCRQRTFMRSAHARAGSRMGHGSR